MARLIVANMMAIAAGIILTGGCVRHEINPNGTINQLAGRCIELTVAQRIFSADSGDVVGFLVGNDVSGPGLGDELGTLSAGDRLIVEKPVFDEATLGHAYVDVIARRATGPVSDRLRIRSLFDGEWLSAAKASILADDPRSAPDIDAALDPLKARWCGSNSGGR